jgi:hypothetical protein
MRKGGELKNKYFFTELILPISMAATKSKNLRMSHRNDFGAYPTPIRLVPIATPPFDLMLKFTPILVPFDRMPKADHAPF